jgi:ribosomal protein S27AE
MLIDPLWLTALATLRRSVPRCSGGTVMADSISLG